MIPKHKIHSSKYNDCAKKNKPSGNDILYARIMLEYSLAPLFRVSQLEKSIGKNIRQNPRIIAVGFPKN